MNEPNGTLLQWMTRIDERLEGIELRLIDKDDHQAVQERVSEVEKRTQHLEVKQAGISAAPFCAWAPADFSLHYGNSTVSGGTSGGSGSGSLETNSGLWTPIARP